MTALAGVPGLSARPARQPASRIAFRVRLACAVGLGVDRDRVGAGASANSAICCSGRSIIRWTSIAPPASWTWSAIAPATSGPIVIGGTKCAVHDVDVDHPRAGVHHLGDLGAEPREVGGEDRGRDPAAE